MTAIQDLGAGVQSLVAAIRDLALDPLDQIQALLPLASYRPAGAYGPDAVGQAQAAAQAATAALGRRAALAAIGRAVAACAPPSYDEAVSLRDQVAGLLEAEAITAADAGDDRSWAALRQVRVAVIEDLNRKSAGLARLQQVQVGAPLPALVHAYRLYGDPGRADELSAYAGAADPNFLPVTFRALGR